MKIAVTRSLSERYDSRLIKECNVLETFGTVATFTWSREPFFKKAGDQVGTGSSDEFYLPVLHGNRIIILVLPFFWIWLLTKLFKFSPDCIHSTDLHSLFPAFIYRFLKPKTKVVYDMYDVISIFWRNQRSMYSILRLFEEKAVSRSDAFIATSSERLALFSSENRLTAIVPNYPLLSTKKRQAPLKEKKQLLVRYAGGIGDDFLTRQLVEGCKKSTLIRLELAGRITGNANSILAEIKDGDATYKGILPYAKALAFMSEADVIPVFYSKKLGYMASSSKFFEALMMGVPVITNVYPDIISSENCGLFIEDVTSDSISVALTTLIDNPYLLNKLRSNALIATETKYNWSIVAKELKLLYALMLSQKS